jgi:hypothetical protein
MTTQVDETQERKIERIVHEALGRQLRSMSLLALLLGVLGFFVGHFVAASYSRQVNERLEVRLAALQGQIGVLTDRCNRMEDQHAETLTSILQIEQLHLEAAQHDASALRTLIVGIDAQRAASIQQLDTYITRRLYVPPAVVTAAMNRLVDDQLLRMERVLANVESRLPAEALAIDSAADAHPGAIAAAPPPPVEIDDEVISSRPRQIPANAPTRGPLTVTQPADDGVDDSAEYFQQPPRRGFLFISRSQPGERLDSTQVSESDAIPLPPR